MLLLRLLGPGLLESAYEECMVFLYGVLLFLCASQITSFLTGLIGYILCALREKTIL